jgi:hypothetical protein
MSTTVLYAGNVGNRPVVSIFSNPVGQQGSNVPLNNPVSNLDRIYLDTRLQYLQILDIKNFTQTFQTVAASPIDNPNSVTTDYEITSHDFGYTPACFLVDYDTREVILSNMYIQIIKDRSFRSISLIADNSKYYIRERTYSSGDELPSITRRFSLLILDNTAEVPSFN